MKEKIRMIYQVPDMTPAFLRSLFATSNNSSFAKLLFRVFIIRYAIFKYQIEHVVEYAIKNNMRIPINAKELKAITKQEAERNMDGESINVVARINQYKHLFL